MDISHPIVDAMTPEERNIFCLGFATGCAADLLLMADLAKVARSQPGSAANHLTAITLEHIIKNFRLAFAVAFSEEHPLANEIAAAFLGKAHKIAAAEQVERDPKAPLQ